MAASPPAAGQGFSVEAQAILAVFQAQMQSLTATIQAAYEPAVAHDRKTGPLEVAIDLRGARGRLQVEVWVKSSGAAAFIVEGSADGENFRQTDTIELPAAGDAHAGYMNAYPVLRVSTTAPGDNEIEIVAAR